jgi:hypothetical protein
MTFANVGGACSCERCGAPCRVDPVPGSQAKLLKRSARPRGLCASCAVHDHLRHLYPVNLTLARGGPQLLAHPHIQQMYLDLLRMAGTDVTAEEIDWQAIIRNWDLPFPTAMLRFAQNPVSEEEIAMARLEGQQRRAGTWKEPLTEEEFEAQRQAAIKKFFDGMDKERHEDPSADRRDGD